MKTRKVLVTVQSGNKSVYHLVNGVVGVDGKTRVDRAVIDNAVKQLGMPRGHCYRFG